MNNKQTGLSRNLAAIVIISASITIVPLASHVRHKKEWYHLALVILVSGCPCALLLSTPVAMFCALSKAATLGVLFKGAEHLETLAGIKIVAFDKTGTITRGEFLVVDFKSLQDDISLNTLLYWICSTESKSSHPMADALVEFARSLEIKPKPERVENFQNFPGEGISGKIEDNEIYIGNWKIASRAGCSTVPKLEGYDTEGKSVGYVFLGSSPAGIFCLSDVCRTGAKEAIEELKSLGIKTVMLTGDSHGAAEHAQEQLGGALDIIQAELLPEDKASIIKELQKEGPTAMIGDGLNDAIALSTADIGISMGISGSALATESADVVLLSNDIQRIAKACLIAKRVRRTIIENVIVSVSTKAAIVGLAICGHPLVWAAVLADVGTCLLVIFNSMLLLRGTPRGGKKCCKSQWHFRKQSRDIESQKKCCDSKGHFHKHSRDIESQTKCCNSEGHFHKHELEHQSCSSEKLVSECGSSDSGSGSCASNKCLTEKGHKKHSHELESPRSHNHCSGNAKSIQKHNHRTTEKEGGNHETARCDHDHQHKHSTGCKGSSPSSISNEQEISINDRCRETHCINHKNDNQSEITLDDEKAVEACLGLDKIHGGCCAHSFRRECCIIDGNPGTGLGGGLSEIAVD